MSNNLPEFCSHIGISPWRLLFDKSNHSKYSGVSKEGNSLILQDDGAKELSLGQIKEELNLLVLVEVVISERPVFD